MDTVRPYRVEDENVRYQLSLLHIIIRGVAKAQLAEVSQFDAVIWAASAEACLAKTRKEYRKAMLTEDLVRTLRIAESVELALEVLRGRVDSEPPITNRGVNLCEGE